MSRMKFSVYKCDPHGLGWGPGVPAGRCVWRRRRKESYKEEWVGRTDGEIEGDGHLPGPWSDLIT